MPGGIDSYEVLSKQYPCVNICARSDLQKSLDSSCFRINPAAGNGIGRHEGSKSAVFAVAVRIQLPIT